MSVTAGSASITVEPWIVPPIWRGQTVFIIGGGASLQGFDFDQLWGRPLIALNASAYSVLGLAGAQDLLFGHDAAFFLGNPDLVARWPGISACISETAAQRFAGRINLLKLRQVLDFPKGMPWVRNGRSSGHTAISIAIAGGARRVVLLGYDMQLTDGRSHFHGHYSNPERVFRTDFLPKFQGWDQAARRAGVEVLNASPRSALKEFRKVALNDVLLP